MSPVRARMIACRTVLKEMEDVLPPDLESLALESGLHLDPEKLRGALQAMIDEITNETETIILGFGLCSLGVIGLRATNSTLVIPRVDDCIAILLGSRRAYQRELKREPGTYFLSKGWIDARITILDEWKRMGERYGQRNAGRIMKRMFRNYRRLAFIEMGQQDQEQYRQFSKRAAKELGLTYQAIKGTPRLLGKICNGPWDDDFVVAPPRHTIRL